MCKQKRERNTPLAPVSLYALCTGKGGKANILPAPVSTYASRTGNDGSESPQRSRLLDVYALCVSKSESAMPRLLQSARMPHAQAMTAAKAPSAPGCLMYMPYV